MRILILAAALFSLLAPSAMAHHSAWHGRPEPGICPVGYNEEAPANACLYSPGFEALCLVGDLCVQLIDGFDEMGNPFTARSGVYAEVLCNQPGECACFSAQPVTGEMPRTTVCSVFF